MIHALVFAAVLVAQPAAAAPPSNVPVSLVLIHRDGDFRFVEDAATLPAEDLAAAESVWAWTQFSAPRKFSPAAFDPTLLESDEDFLTVRAPVSESTKDTPLWVLAAPVSMWEEVPESWIPGWLLDEDGSQQVPRDPGQPWRVRLVSDALGSWWSDVGPSRSTAVVRPVAAPVRELRVTAEDGSPVNGADVRVLAGVAARLHRAQTLARYRGDDKGRWTVETLPSQEATTVVSAEGYAPAVLQTGPAGLPDVVVLQAGARLVGRVVDDEDRPRPDARLSLETWVSGTTPWLDTRETPVAEDGTFHFDGLRRGKVAVAAVLPGYSRTLVRIDVQESPVDAGTLVLRRGGELPVLVVDDAGVPVVGAELEALGEHAATDGEGRAVLANLALDSPVEVKVSAPGHLPSKIVVPPPWPEIARLRLERAFRLVGRFLDPDGLPVNGGRAQTKVENQKRFVELSTDGRFEVDVEPGVDLRLSLSSPATRTLEVGEVKAGPAGGVLDLGDLVAPPGLAVTGTLLGPGGLPVAGARIWTPRSQPGGPIIAWMKGDCVETRSAVDGTFTLGGLSLENTLLRVDASGLARLHVTADPGPDGHRQVDLGVLEMVEGADVRLRVDSEEEHLEGTVRLDLRGERMPFDDLIAPLHGREAVVRNVPPGTFRVAVQNDRKTLCEVDVEVPAHTRGVEAACKHGTLRLTGSVWVGTEPAPAGHLTWSAAVDGTTGVGDGIVNIHSPSGLRQVHSYSNRRESVTLEVYADGTYDTRDVSAGAWKVRYRGISGHSTAPLAVEVPVVEAFELPLHFAAGTLRGRVVDTDGNAVAQAVVQEVHGAATTRSAEDGRFVIQGLQPGTRQFQARLYDERSQIATVEVVTDREVETIELVLGSEENDRVTVRVFTASGEPAPGVLTFLELDVGGFRVVSTDMGGEASFRLSSPFPSKVRAAARVNGAWTLGDWQESADAAGEGLVLEGVESGSLQLVSEDGGSPEIVAFDGWDVGRLLMRLGRRLHLARDQPLTLSGLPPGSYTVVLGETTRRVTVRAGETDVVELDQ